MNFVDNDLKYGVRHRGSALAVPIGIEASQVFKNKGGKFVSRGDNGYAEKALAADTELLGWLEVEEFTSSATAGRDRRNMISGLDAEFVIPIAYDGDTYTTNYSDDLIGKTCDIVVVSDVQKADLDASSTDVLVITGGVAAATGVQGKVYCRLNPNKMFVTGVA